MDLKKPLTFEEQLQKLKDHGIVISDDTQAIQVLKKINYYRFTGYALQFRQDPKKSNYIEEQPLIVYITYIWWMSDCVIYSECILRRLR